VSEKHVKASGSTKYVGTRECEFRGLSSSMNPLLKSLERINSPELSLLVFRPLLFVAGGALQQGRLLDTP
jgi:hypothetical protein